MSFLVTARKWRPQIFEEVVGQEHITTTLKNAIKNERIAHAYIFAGPRGVGKTTTARILAKTLNCLNSKDGNPCGECEMCKAFLNSQSLDIIEIDGASNRRIEEIRTLRESVKYAPTKGEYKVYIIDEVHMLTPESFNALLKTLEEPPEHTLFIFATTDIHKVPLTIISRCQRFDFRRIELNVIKDQLKKIADAEKIKIDDQSLTLIAKKADGALRDAQSLFDQVISFCGNNVEVSTLQQMLNLIDEEIYFRVTDAILKKEFKTAFEVAQQIYDNGWNFIDFVNGLIEHFRNLMVITISKKTDNIEAAEVFKEKYMQYQESFSEGDLLRMLAFLNKIQYELKTTQSQRLKVEISLCHLIGLEKSETLSKIIEKLDDGSDDNSDSLFGGGGKEIKTAPKKNELKKTPEHEASTTSYSSKPEIQSFTPPDVNLTPDLREIANRWQNFVEQVSSEKVFLGNHLHKSLPVNVKNDKLEIALTNPDDGKIIKDNEDYLKCLEKNAENIFGKKVEFKFSQKNSEEMGSQSPAPSVTSTPQNNNSEKSEQQKSNLVDAVINQLGGKEIKNN